MAFINVDIPDELKARLEAEARRDLSSQRRVIVRALETYLDAREQASGLSATMSEAAQTAKFEVLK